MFLTSEDCRYLIRLTQREVVVKESESFRFQITREGHGYHADDNVARIQVILSIMMEAARLREERDAPAKPKGPPAQEVQKGGTP